MQANMQRGYFNLMIPDNRKDQNRSLRPISFQLLRLILHIQIFGLNQINVLKQNDLEVIIPHKQSCQQQLNKSLEQYLQCHINRDLQSIYEQLDIDRPYVWIFQILKQILTIIQQNSPLVMQNLSSTQQRDQFEISFQNQIVDNLLNQKLEVVRQYEQNKLALQKMKEPFDTVINESRCIDDQQEFKYLKLFRITKRPTFASMKNQFDLELRNQPGNKILEVCFDFQQEAEKLKAFFPILRLVKLLKEKYDYMISREDARVKKIQDVCDEDDEINKAFQDFKQAIKLFGQEPVQYGCKELLPLDYDESSDLTSLLIDNKEQGGGMYLTAVLISLANTQNNLLQAILENYMIENNIKDPQIIERIPCSILKINKSHILSIDLEDPEYYKLAVCNPEYGNGKQNLVFAFDQIKAQIIQQLSQKKFLDTENMQLINYQFELLSQTGSQSSLILDIRQKIQQKTMEKDLKVLIDSYLSNKNINRREQSQDVLPEQYFKQLLASLDKIMCILKYEKVNQQMKIYQFCQGQKKQMFGNINECFKKDSDILGQIALENIISLYEIIEGKCFQFVFKSLRPDYCKQQQNMKELIMSYFRKEETEKQNIFTKKQLQEAMKKFIIRCLQVELTPQTQLITYLSNEQFWDENEQEKLQFFEINFNPDIQIKHSQCAYQSLENIIQEEQRLINQQFEQLSQRNRNTTNIRGGNARGRGGSIVRGRVGDISSMIYHESNQ